MKLLIVFQGNEGSSYFIDELNKLDLLHHLGYEHFDGYKYKEKNIKKKDIFKMFSHDIITAYNKNYNNKIPYCKCRLFNYENLTKTCNILNVIKKANITHIIFLYRYEFEHVIRYHYLKIYEKNRIGFHHNLGQFDKNRNDNFKKYKGKLKIDKEKFKLSVKSKINYMKKKQIQLNELRKLNTKLLILSYEELIKINIKLEIEKFFDHKFKLKDVNVNVNVNDNDRKKNFKWINLFNEDSKIYLENEELKYNNMKKSLTLK
jgi:hypothetical protein